MRLPAVCASLLIAAGVAPGAFGQDGLATIDGCLQRLDQQSGYEEIAARCPDLIPRLQASGSAQWLPGGWSGPGSDLSTPSLRELRHSIAYQLALRAPSPSPDTAELKTILRALGPMETTNTGLWARFTRWLREALERRDPAPGHSLWDLAHASPSQTVIDLICYACLAAVVVMAVAVIANELRVAGAFAPRRRRNGGDPRVRSDRVPTSGWDTIASASPPDRPRLILELISARLIELKRLPPAAGFTVRELLQAVRSMRGEDRTLLADVALAAERVRFSGEPVAAASLEAVVERGRRLLEHLSA